jgi:hypothetical protein
MQQNLKELFVNQYNSLHLSENSPRSVKGRGRFRFPPRKNGRHAVSRLVRSSIISRLFSALAALWMCGDTAAWAGDGGGASFASLQAFITNNVCPFIPSPPSLSTPGSFTICPTVPTVSQGVLQLAAYYFSSLGAVRSNFNIPVAPYIDAANPSRPPAIPLDCPNTAPNTTCGNPPPDPLNPFSGLPVNPSVLDTLQPLVFIAANKSNGTPTPTQLDDPNGNIHFYAVGARSSTSKLPGAEPDKLVLFYEDSLRSNQNLMSGQVSASFSAPLMVLNTDGVTERPVSAILHYIAPNKQQLDCSTSTIVGDFKGTGTAQTLTPPSLVGVDCAVAFGSGGAVFELSVPFLVTLNTDFITVDNPLGFFPGQKANAFIDDAPGYPPKSGILGSNEQSIGIGPSAAPLVPACATASPPTCTAPPATYAFCANLPQQGNGQPPVPAVTAFYAISSAGAEVLLSAPLAPIGPNGKVVSIPCPSGM